MRYLADLHIHSPFSRGTSPTCDLAHLFAWARVKGIQVVGTGDFTHPAWFATLQEQLVPAEPGLFRLKDENVAAALPEVAPEEAAVRFVLTAEISSIYKRDGRVRKVHNCLFVPDFQAASRINATLAGIGNIESDGRPILGLDARDLLEILLEHAPEGFLVPAHIWTPWFSILGSKSGFDSIEACFADLSDHVFALETGLSSDPDMNRLVSSLDRYTLISNSDAHSPAKLGREVNLFATELDFFAMREALKNPLHGGFQGTVEFFPEEGKYHFDGHRKCEVCLAPAETRRLKGLCPRCGHPVTVGVHHRVCELADREIPCYPPGSPTFSSLVPLCEVLGEILDVGPGSKAVLSLYSRLISQFGSEFKLLLEWPLDEIDRRSSPLLGEAIRRMRARSVIRTPGFDGEFGVIKVFAAGERDRLRGQLGLFGQPTGRKSDKQRGTGNEPPPAGLREEAGLPQQPLPAAVAAKKLNPEQEQAACSAAPAILVSAGPGTGKTATLIGRLSRLLSTPEADPGRFVVITFTNRAAREIRERLAREIGAAADAVFVGTFHGFCLARLREYDPGLVPIGDEGRDIVIRKTFPQLNRTEVEELRQALAAHFAQPAVPAESVAQPEPRIREYLAALASQHAIDLDGIVPALVELLESQPTMREKLGAEIGYLFVDEFQDLNGGQYRLVELLAERARLFAIGDPDQAIYGFRGSDRSLFFAFRDRFRPEALALCRNYRSAPPILEAAAALISHSQEPSGVRVLAQRQGSGPIDFLSTPSAEAEAQAIVAKLEELVGGTSHRALDRGRTGSGATAPERSFGDIAILFRLGQQAGPLAEALERAGIPFQLVGVKPFFMRAAARPAYLWIRAATAATGDGATQLALLGAVPGIGETTIRRLEQAIPLDCPDVFGAAQQLPLAVATQKRIAVIGNELTRFRAWATTESIAAALEKILPLLAIERTAPEVDRFLKLSGAFGQELAALASHQIGRASCRERV